MKAPERIYTVKEHEAPATTAAFKPYPQFPVEYIRSDIAEAEAEKLAKEFAMLYGDWMIDFSSTADTLDELFTEFLTSRKAQ